ncbi:MAG: helix-turn-helix domain-containing protein [Armatimonadota bacterium]
MEELLTPKEVMEMLRIGRTTLHKLVREGKLPAVHIGYRTYRFRSKDVEAFIESARKGG